MVRSGRVTPPRWLAVAGLLRPRRPTDLCRARGDWDVGQDAGRAAPAPRALGHLEDAAVLTAAAEESIRRPAGPVQSALGATRACRGDHLSRLDRRATAPPHCLCRTERR